MRQNCPNCVSCSPVLETYADVGVQPVARVVNYDDVLKTIDANGCIGDFIKLVVKRSGATIEESLPIINTGVNQIPYTSTLQNGDVICVQATFDNFSTYDEDCKVIPFAVFGFVPVT
jgi:hypothetical protein